MNKEKYYPLLVALSMICIGVLMRVLPHPANFAPITAIAIFGGSVLPKKLAVWAPLGAMIVSDAIIGFYPLMPLIWICYLSIALMSYRWLRPASVSRGAVVTLSSSILFFVVTNFGVWVASGMYSHTVAGFIRCYVMAIPFFRNSLVSDVMFTVALFTTYQLATNRAARGSLATKFTP